MWRHQKICKFEEPQLILQPISTMPDITFLTNLILEVVKNNAELQKQNQDYQKQVIDLYKSNNTTNIQHNNSHNKTFNLQFFLNETCKDAMNIMDFVNSMTLELADLEEVGKLGYVEGISNIIIRKLNALDVHKRPIHCSDGKREIMFVKDDNIWEKEIALMTNCAKPLKASLIKTVPYSCRGVRSIPIA